MNPVSKNVSRIGLAPSASAIHTSTRFPPRSDVKAILRPSVEKVGQCSERLDAAMVTGLRRATGTSDQLAGPPPTLQDMNIDLVGCTPLEIENIERMVRVIWERAAKQ